MNPNLGAICVRRIVSSCGAPQHQLGARRPLTSLAHIQAFCVMCQTQKKNPHWFTATNSALYPRRIPSWWVSHPKHVEIWAHELCATAGTAQTRKAASRPAHHADVFRYLPWGTRVPIVASIIVLVPPFAAATSSEIDGNKSLARSPFLPRIIAWIPSPYETRKGERERERLDKAKIPLWRSCRLI